MTILKIYAPLICEIIMKGLVIASIAGAVAITYVLWDNREKKTWKDHQDSNVKIRIRKATERKLRSVKTTWLHLRKMLSKLLCWE